jgi:putative hydrolase of the HAD superfamily
MIRAVLFDVDDTLVDYSGAERAGITRHLRDLGVSEDLVPGGVSHWHWLVEHHFPRYLSGELTLQDHRRERVRDMLRWLGGPVPRDTAAIDAWFAGYQQRYERALAPFPDVVACLDRLSGVPLGVVTNHDTGYQRAKLARLGLVDRFTCVVGTEFGGARKPDPAIFLAACEALEVPASATAHVGDRLDHDARGATDAGLYGVWLSRSGGPVTELGVPYITTLAALPRLLGFLG